MVCDEIICSTLLQTKCNFYTFFILSWEVLESLIICEVGERKETGVTQNAAWKYFPQS
jgi:hypothetical protein